LNKRYKNHKNPVTKDRTSLINISVLRFPFLSPSKYRRFGIHSLSPSNAHVGFCVQTKAQDLSLVVWLTPHLSSSMWVVAVTNFLRMQYHHLHHTYISLPKFPSCKLSSSFRNRQQSRKPFAYKV